MKIPIPVYVRAVNQFIFHNSYEIIVRYSLKTLLLLFGSCFVSWETSLSVVEYQHSFIDPVSGDCNTILSLAVIFQSKHQKHM